MKPFKYVFALLCVLALGAASGVGVSEPTELKEILSLTDEQVQQLRNINMALAEAVKPDKEQIRTLQSQLRAELASDAANAAVIGQLQLDIRNLMDQIAATRSDYVGTARAVLTPGQMAVLASLEQALALAGPARQAVTLNLIETDGVAGFGDAHRGQRRPRGRGGR